MSKSQNILKDIPKHKHFKLVNFYKIFMADEYQFQWADQTKILSHSYFSPLKTVENALNIVSC